MTTVGSLYRGAVFMVTCLLSATLMQLLLREYDFLFKLPVGLTSLALGVGCAWSALRPWRFVAPIRLAAMVGLCAGFGDAGLFIMVVHAFGYLFPSYICPVPSL